MQLNLLEITQQLVDELLQEEEKNRHRVEGIAMLFHRIQQAHAEAQQHSSQAVESNVQG